jgi:hypothetical protein
MKAFISYSHNDIQLLDILHKHLTQLQREGLIQTWEDRKIQAGDVLEKQIFHALEASQLFLALLSPDYIASTYCYEKEFQRAIQRQQAGELMIVPIILEPCDWLSTPFSKFKALPKDGKPVSTWENRNTAFLDVAQNIRKLVQGDIGKQTIKLNTTSPLSRNYRVQKDFDSIERLEYVEKTFHDIKEFMRRNIEEVIQIDNVKVRVLKEDGQTFKALLVNRNKVATETELTITTQATQQRTMGFNQGDDRQISFMLGNNSHPAQKSFTLSNDEYELFWTDNNFYSGRRSNTRFTSKEIVDAIWDEWLSSVGIL